jgi:hypothetical protein
MEGRWEEGNYTTRNHVTKPPNNTAQFDLGGPMLFQST